MRVYGRIYILIAFCITVCDASKTPISNEERVIQLLQAGIQNQALQADDIEKIYKSWFIPPEVPSAARINIQNPLNGSVFLNATEKIRAEETFNHDRLKELFDQMLSQQDAQSVQRSECLEMSKILPLELKFSVVQPSDFYASLLQRGDPNDSKKTKFFRISHAFEVSQTAITIGMWQKVFGRIPDAFLSAPKDAPIRGVDYLSMLVFLNELSRIADLTPAYDLNPILEYVAQNAPNNPAPKMEDLIHHAAKGKASEDFLAASGLPKVTSIVPEGDGALPPVLLPSIYRASGYRLMTRIEAAVVANQVREYLNTRYSPNHTKWPHNIKDWPDDSREFMPFPFESSKWRDVGAMDFYQREKPLLLLRNEFRRDTNPPREIELSDFSEKSPIFDLLDVYPTALHEKASPSVGRADKGANWNGEVWSDGELYHYGERYFHPAEHILFSSTSLAMRLRFEALRATYTSSSATVWNPRAEDFRLAGAVAYQQDWKLIFHAVRTLEPEKIPDTSPSQRLPRPTLIPIRPGSGGKTILQQVGNWFKRFPWIR